MSFINRNYRDSVDIYVTLSAESTSLSRSLSWSHARYSSTSIITAGQTNRDVSKKAQKVAHEENYRIFLFSLHKTHSLPFLVKMSIYHYDTPEKAKVLYLFVLFAFVFLHSIWNTKLLFRNSLQNIHIFLLKRQKIYWSSNILTYGTCISKSTQLEQVWKFTKILLTKDIMFKKTLCEKTKRTADND